MTKWHIAGELQEVADAVIRAALVGALTAAVKLAVAALRGERPPVEPPPEKVGS